MCVLQVAVRFMCMRRGYEYLLEAWGALWTAAEATVAIPAAVGALGAVSVAGSTHVATAESAAAGTPGSASAEVVDAGLPRSGGGNGYGVGSGDCVHAGAAGLVPSPSSPTAARRQLPTPLARLTGVGALAAASTHATAAAAAAACTVSPTNAHPARSRHSRISHVDQLWAPCTQTSALQVGACRPMHGHMSQRLNVLFCLTAARYRLKFSSCVFCARRSGLPFSVWYIPCCSMLHRFGSHVSF